MPVCTITRVPAAGPGAMACRFRSGSVALGPYWPGFSTPTPKHTFFNAEIEEPQGPIQKADAACFVLPWKRVRPRVHESLVCVTVLKDHVKYRAETTDEDMDARLPPKRKDESTLK